MSNNNVSSYFNFSSPAFLGRYYQCVYLYPFIIVIGTASNALALVTISRYCLIRNNTYFCLALLSISDSAVILISCPRHWLRFVAKVDIQVINTGTCKILLFLEYISVDMTVWIMILITLQRFLIVRFPLRAHTMCSTRKTRYSLLFIFCLACLKNIPVLIQARISKLASLEICNLISDDIFWSIFSWVDLIFRFLVPSPMLILLNCLIYRELRQMNHIRKELLITVRSASSRRDRKHQETAQRQMPRDTKRLFPLLLCVNVTFLICYAPYGFFMLCDSIQHFFLTRDSSLYQLYTLVYQSCITLIYLNLASNFFLFIASGTHFRYYFRRMIFRKQMDKATNNNLFVSQQSIRKQPLEVITQLNGPFPSMQRSQSSLALPGQKLVSASEPFSLVKRKRHAGSVTQLNCCEESKC